MKLEQKKWNKNERWLPSQHSMLADKAEIVFIFGETSLLKEGSLLKELKNMYPKAHQFGCSTSGEIHGTSVSDNTLSTVAIQFENTKMKHAEVHLKSVNDSFEAGTKLAKNLDQNDLSHVLVFSVGLNVNGSEIVKGLASVLPEHVSITGGLAGDQDRFHETVVISDEGPSNDMVAVVGLYGKNIKIGSASLGGWDPFGPERLITKARGNILYELDGKSALQLYKSYLGKHAENLPGSALLFPLCMRTSENPTPIVRTILAVDEKEQSMTFAGDIIEGAYARLMKANFDRLIDGAKGAAEKSMSKTPELALLISCVGRKLVLKQRIEEEIEGVRKVFGDKTMLTGFYSYGEISPFTPNAKCELHNQTMTITTLSEEINGRKAS